MERCEQLEVWSESKEAEGGGMLITLPLNSFSHFPEAHPEQAWKGQ